MKIIGIPESLRKIYPIEVENDSIKVVGKDGSTLLLTPIITDDAPIEYEMEYLTKKEVKEIDKLNRKKDEISKKIDEIMSNGIQKDGEKEDDEKIDNYENEDEIIDESFEEITH